MLRPRGKLAPRLDAERVAHAFVTGPSERHEGLQKQDEVATDGIRRQPLQAANAGSDIQMRERPRKREELERPQRRKDEQALTPWHTSEKARNGRCRIDATRPRTRQGIVRIRHQRLGEGRKHSAIARTKPPKPLRIHGGSVSAGCGGLSAARRAGSHLATCRAMRIRLGVGALLLAAAVAATAAHGAATVSIYTIAGTSDGGFKGDGGPAAGAALNGPAGIVVAPDGAIVIADTINQRIRRIDPKTQTIRTIAGTGARGFSGDAGPATSARLQDPSALAYAMDGSLVFADAGNDRIRAIRPNGTIITLAGSADQGFSGDGGPATDAQLNSPSGVAADNGGRIFIADTGNNRIRVIQPDGRIATVAGTGHAGAAGDGGLSTAAQLNAPAGLAIDSNGSLLVADAGNNKIRRISVTGTITTVAGTGGGRSAGDGGPATNAQLNLPVDVVAGPRGGFFVAEQGGNRIRRVDANGTITRLAGTGGPRFGGDGRAATSALRNAPHALELMPSGFEVLVADSDNNRVRYVAIPGQATLLALALPKAEYRAKLVKVKRGRHRVLVVRDPRIGFSLTRDSDLTFRIRTKGARAVATWRVHAGAGAGTVRLPRRLLGGKRRLTKAHYVVGVTAKSGTASAAAAVELVVK